MSGNKKNAKHQKTMDYILSFLRNMKTRRYRDINNLLYNIRTNDLRDLLETLGPDHLFYRYILEVLHNSSLENAHCEALYNLAVILGEKKNVPAIIRRGGIDIILSFKNNPNTRLLHNVCWCLFGIASTEPQYRQLCIDKGVLNLAIELMITREEDSITDIGGQIIYGMFHMRPYPSEEMSKPFFERIPDLLQLNDNSLKYILWSLHFATSSNQEILKKLNIEKSLKPLIKSNQSSSLIPLMIIISDFFKISSSDLHEYLDELKSPLFHTDSNVRLQACRTTAEYARSEKTVNEMLNDGIYEIIITKLNNEDQHIREQAVYAVLRGFGLGSIDDKRKLAELGGLEVITSYLAIAIAPFNSNLLDCLNSLVEEDFEFFTNKLKEINAVSTFYQLLTSHDEALTAKAANLLSLVGDNYSKDEF